MNTVIYSKEKCLTCHQCEMACAIQHSHSGNIYSAISEPVNPKSRIFIECDPSGTVSIPNKCRHCNPAPCVSSCPSGALKRAEETDVVLSDENKCIGCRNCLVNCPFGVIIFRKSNKSRSGRFVSIKCDECIDRTSGSSLPACVEACKTGALQYGELDSYIKARRKMTLISLNNLTEQSKTISDQFSLFKDLNNRCHSVGK